MNSRVPPSITEVPEIFCRGETETLSRWLREVGTRPLLQAVTVIVAGCGAYGYTIGLWRGPVMALFVAVKLPLLIFLIVAANGLLNGIFAQLLGSGFSFRQTVQTILMSFTTFALVVGALSPITFFLAVNTPRPDTAELYRWHGFTLLTHTLVIAYAGILSNRKMFRLMVAFSGNAHAARLTFFAWTGGNLFVGAQLAFVLRPFFGSPGLPVAFLRPDPLNGNFYEAVYVAANNFTGGHAHYLVPAALLMAIYYVCQTFKVPREVQIHTQPNK